MTMNEPTSHPKWYHNVWVVLLMLFFVLGPLGLPLVWSHPRFSQRTKWILTAVTALYTILLIDVTIRAVRGAVQLFNQLAF
ncbi:MAG: hypothetical protein HY595_03590 [Candidatus Omnitrophica bacterium]|nr:hypothetical protein [Candidatus Omnitrophota bacterium]